jgi:hypothetical protein
MEHIMTTTVRTTAKPGFRTLFCAAALALSPLILIAAPLIFFGSDDTEAFLAEVRESRGTSSSSR